MALATNGTLVTGRVAAHIADTGFSRVAISLDGAAPATHDAFRGLPGSHALAIRGLRNLRDEGVSVQINSTIAKHNVTELPKLLDLALELGADALHLFMLVPVGCGLEIAPSEMLPADDTSASCIGSTTSRGAARSISRRPVLRTTTGSGRSGSSGSVDGDRTGTFIAPGTRAKAARRCCTAAATGRICPR